METWTRGGSISMEFLRLDDGLRSDLVVETRFRRLARLSINASIETPSHQSFERDTHHLKGALWSRTPIPPHVKATLPSTQHGLLSDARDAGQHAGICWWWVEIPLWKYNTSTNTPPRRHQRSNPRSRLIQHSRGIWWGRCAQIRLSHQLRPPRRWEHKSLRRECHPQSQTGHGDQESLR